MVTKKNEYRIIKHWNIVSDLKGYTMKTLFNTLYFGISMTYGMYLNSITTIHMIILNNIWFKFVWCIWPWLFVVALVSGLKCYRCIPKGSNSSASSEECMNSIDTFGKLQRCRNTIEGAACMLTSIGKKKLPRIIISFRQENIIPRQYYGSL